ncbi:DNA primase [Rickettsiales bacterium Ac37b]|nr:DNA primase [Rickettsiales bacterium Ac37b]
MYFSESFIEKIRERFRLSEIISRKVKLSRKGNEYLGLCPFHSEKTPSFTVNDEKNFYHCFGCGAHGDVIKFIGDTSNLNFVEVITSLAEEAGFSIEYNKSQLEYHNYTKDLYQALQLACNYFQNQLFSTVGKEAYSYLQHRNINTTYIKKFLLGYAPGESYKLKEFLLSQGISNELMIKAGLMVHGSNNDIYSRFRNRLIFPISDYKGRIIGFGGRALSNEVMPKYLNSSETDVFKKSEILYGLNFAKEASNKSGKIIVVEGYMDCISMNIAGIEEVVASLGTAINKEHILNLWKYSKVPVICLDGDRAGRQAMLRVAENIMPILKPGYSVDFVLLTMGKDPDELIKNYGKDAMLRSLESTITLSDFIWQESIRELSSALIPEQRALLEKHLENIVNKIRDNTVAHYYRQYFKNKLWEYFKKSKIKQVDINQEQINRIKLNTVQDISSIQLLQQLLVAITVKYPEILSNDQAKEEFISMDFGDEKLDKLRTLILNSKELNIIDSTILHSYLEKNTYNDEMNFLYGHYKTISYIVNGFNTCIDMWNYNIKKYHIALLEQEYQDVLRCMTESSVSIASALKAQIIYAKKHLNKMEQSLQHNDY